MVTARLHDMRAGAYELPAPAPGNTWLIYEVGGTAEELDGAIRVVPTLLTALGPVNVAVVESADTIGRIAAAVAWAMSPNSPGGTGVTLAEALGAAVEATRKKRK